MISTVRISAKCARRVACAAREGVRCSSHAASAAKPEFAHSHDYYPSRGGDAATMERIHPVVWDEDRAGPLSRPELQQYKANGFIVMPEVFSPLEVDALKQELYRVRGVLQDDKSAIRKVTDSTRAVTEPSKSPDEPSILRSVFEVHKWNTVCNTLSRDARLVGAAQQILDDDVYIHQSRINFQPAFRGTGFYHHSDIETWHCEDGVPLPRAVSAVVMLTDNQPANGALMVMPGSHTTFIQCPGRQPEKNWESSLQEQQKYGVPPTSILREIGDKCGMQHCSGPAGSVILFDSNLLHASHNNISPWERLNAFFVFNSVNNTPQHPFAADSPRPEHIATRDPDWLHAIRPLRNPKYTQVVADAKDEVVVN